MAEEPAAGSSELVNFSVTPAGVGASECLAVVAAR
jgi:hypothetical protein